MNAVARNLGVGQAISARIAKAMPAGVTRFPVKDRASWLAMRGQDVTASVAAALIGEHPYMTRLGLYALKTGQAPDSEVEPVITENSISLPPMLRGTILEPVVPPLLAMLRPTWQVEPCAFYYREPAARLGATPDLFAVDPIRRGQFGIIQVKTTEERTFRKVWRNEGDEEAPVVPPDFILIQAIIEATLTGAGWAMVAVMISASSIDLHLIEVPIHAGIMGRLRAETAAFWQAIERGDPPPADYGRDAEVLAALSRDDNGQQIDLRADNRLPGLLAELDGLRAEIRERQTRVDEIRCELREAIGPYETALVAGNRKITCRVEQRQQRLVFASESRVLRVR